MFLFYICFGKIDAKKCFITQNTKPFIWHYFLTLVSPLPPTPILFLFFPFNYHFSSNKKLPPTHNNPTPAPMMSLSQPLNPTVERKPAYPKLNTITWTNPKKKKKPSLLRNQVNQATCCCCKNDSLPICCCCRERERDKKWWWHGSKIAMTNSEFFLWLLIVPNHHKVHNLMSNNDKKRERILWESDQL